MKQASDQEDKNVQNDCVEEDHGACDLVTHDETTLHNDAAQHKKCSTRLLIKVTTTELIILLEPDSQNFLRMSEYFHKSCLSFS